MTGARGGRRVGPIVGVVIAVVVVGAVIAALVLRNEGGDDAVVEPPAPGTTSTTAGTVPPTLAALTGLPVDGPVRPALVVKIDNVDDARPQSGLGAADVIVEELVEGGLTRLAAIYSSSDPGRVGPIRSMRLTDLALAELLGRPALAFSGAADPVLAAGTAAAADGTVVLVTPDTAPDVFVRSDDRDAPHNLYAQAPDLWAAAPEARPPAPLFAYGAAAASSPATAFGLGFGSVRVDYRWDASLGAWTRTQDGTPTTLAETGAPLAVANVLVLHVGYSPSASNPNSPVADLDSGGDAWVYRDGAVAICTWSTSPAASTSGGSTAVAPSIELRSPDGKVCALTPGRTILELAPSPPTEA